MENPTWVLEQTSHLLTASRCALDSWDTLLNYSFPDKPPNLAAAEYKGRWVIAPALSSAGSRPAVVCCTPQARLTPAFLPARKRTGRELHTDGLAAQRADPISCALRFPAPKPSARRGQSVCRWTPGSRCSAVLTYCDVGCPITTIEEQQVHGVVVGERSESWSSNMLRRRG